MFSPPLGWRVAAGICAVVITSAAFGATFVVPNDREMIRRADAIVVGRALDSYAVRNARGGIETVTPISIEEVIHSGQSLPDPLNVYEPGGRDEGEVTFIPGVPRFEAGERLLLLLRKTGEDRWAVAELVLGKFRFENDSLGRHLLVRDTAEIHAVGPNRERFIERPRFADEFLTFVRAESQGHLTPATYFVPEAPTETLTAPQPTGALQPKPAIAPFTATSYTMTISGTQGARWAVFPSAVNWYRGTAQEPGAPGGGDTAISVAVASWSNDCGSNVNYVFAGTDPTGTHTQGLHAADDLNTVLFERDLSAWGVGPFTCSGSSYSGTLGLGGITVAAGNNSVNGETFATTLEGDVEMNRGVANCSVLFSSGDFNTAVTHEIGHTLGFRHSDQTRPGNAACTTDPSLECSSAAVMKASIFKGINGVLQAWDQHAVNAVYPGNVCAPGPTCTPPAITAQPSSGTIRVGYSATLTVGASGTSLAYQWFIGASGNTSNPISGATGPSVTVSPQQTTSFWVRVSNACGTVNSATATVTVVAPAPAAKFFLVTPCRILDTRGGTPLQPNEIRTIAVAGNCGVPSAATALAANATVVAPAAIGFVTLYPGPRIVTLPPVSTINYSVNRTLANNARVAIGADGSINIFNSGSAPLHFLIDVSGYFQ